jgi:WD40 repeat protein
MKFDNYDRISRALTFMQSGLTNYVENSLRRHYQSDWFQKGVVEVLEQANRALQLGDNIREDNCWAELDLSKLFFLITNESNWYLIFSKNSGGLKKSHFHSLRSIRNNYAHRNIKMDRFTNEQTIKDLDEMINVLEKIGEKIEAEKIRTLKKRSFNNIPYPRNHSFIGREDIFALIDEKFSLSNGSGKGLAVLTGLGGIGKTQTALEYAFRNEDLYTGGIFWINATVNFETDFNKLANQFVSNFLFETEFNEIQLMQKFSDYLTDNSNTLIIIDNLENLSKLFKPTKGILPVNLSTHLLVTTRKKINYPDIDSIELEGLSPEEAISLLLSGKRRKLKLSQATEFSTLRDDSIDICSSFGYHPLAISLAASYLERYPEITLRSFSARIKLEGSYETSDFIDSSLEGMEIYERPRINLFNLMWEKLEDQKLKKILQIISLFEEPAEIPISLFSVLSGIENEEIRYGRPSKIKTLLEDLSNARFLEEKYSITRKFSLDYSQPGEYRRFLHSFDPEYLEIRYDFHPIIRAYIEQTIIDKNSLIKEYYFSFKEKLQDTNYIQKAILERGIDKTIEEIEKMFSLINSTNNYWLDSDSFLYTYKLVLSSESFELRSWNMIDLVELIDYPNDWMNPIDMPGFPQQQIYNRLVQENKDLAESHRNFLLDNQYRALLELKKISKEINLLSTTIKYHENYIYDLVLSSDNQTLITAGIDGLIYECDLQTNKLLNGYLNEENLYLFTSINKGICRFIKIPGNWNKWGEQELNYLEYEDFAPILSEIINGQFPLERLVAGIDGYSDIIIWDPETKNVIKKIELDQTFLDYPLSSNPLYFSIEDNLLILLSHSGFILWDTNDWSEILRIENERECIYYCWEVIPDQKLIFFGDTIGNIELFDLQTGKNQLFEKIHDDTLTNITLLRENSKEVKIISSSADGFIKQWNYCDDELILESEYGNHENPILDFVLTQDKNIIISSHLNGNIVFREFNSGRELLTINGHSEKVDQLVLSSDDRYLISKSDDLTVKVWNVIRARDEFDMSEGVATYKKVLYWDDNFALAIGSDFIEKIDLIKCEPITHIPFDQEELNGLLFSNKSEELVLFGKMVYIWNYFQESEPEIIFFNDNPDITFIYVTRNLHWGLSISHILITEEDEIQEYKDEVRLWDLKSGDHLNSIFVESFSKRSFMIDESGTRIIAFNNQRHHIGLDNTQLPIYEKWDIPTTNIDESDLNSQEEKIFFVFIPEGKEIIYQKGDDIYGVINLETRQIIPLWGSKIDKDRIVSFSLATDQDLEVLILQDGSLNLWSIEKDYCLATLPGDFVSCSINPIGNIVLAVDKLGQLHYLEVL